MSADETSRFNLSADEVRGYPWQELLNSQSAKECNSYDGTFLRAAKERGEASDSLGERVYSFLYVIASFHPTYDNRITPYRSMRMDPDGTRSLNPSDLTETDLDTLSGIVQEIQDPEFRARVADVLWVCRKQYKMSQVAIHAFLESAQNLKTDDLWPPYVERLERAAQLAGKKGFETECAKVVAAIEADIREFENIQKSGLLCARLMRILLSLEEGDIPRYVALSERFSGEFATAGDWHFSEHYWRIAEQWCRAAKDEVGISRCQIAAAECNVSMALTGLSKEPPQISYAAHWMGQGFEGLRRAKAAPARIKEVNQRFLALQKEALADLTPFDFDPEAMPGLKESRQKTQEAAIKHVSDLDFESAIFRLATIGHPTDVEQLKKNERKNSEGLIWDKLFGVNRLDRDGKIADIMPPMGLAGEDPDQIAFRKKMLQTVSSFGWPMAVEWRIEPARKAIAQEHAIRTVDLAFLVSNNAFIRQGHEGIYLRGIQAGFFGDWLVAMHLLIPQLEASVRYVLQQHGMITSTLESDGTQKERDINLLLWDENAEKIFGMDLLFDLRGILIERFGCNMRNESAHGLMYEGQFYRPEAIYLWWLVIRMCWNGCSTIPNELPEDL